MFREKFLISRKERSLNGSKIGLLCTIKFGKIVSWRCLDRFNDRKVTPFD